MIETILTKIGALMLTPVVFLSTFFVQPQQAPVIEDEALGVALPSGTALFETSLASPITGSASSLTLVANSIRGGGSLSGYQCFTIDEGSAQAEYVCGTVSGTSVTSLERGLSPSDGITQTTALQFSHRRGASVKITDFPLIQRLRSQAVGTGTYETPLQYATTVATSTIGSNSQNIASVAYVNSLSFGGVAASAQEAVSGFVELATGAEAASSTATGTTNARLVLSTLSATSAAPTSGNVIPVTQDDGNLDTNFLPDNYSSTNQYIYTASTTYTKPSGLMYLEVELWGAGGGGAAGGSDVSGGGGGAYVRFKVASSSLGATSSIVIGTGGTGGVTSAAGGAGSSTMFTLASSTLIAYGGAGGALQQNGSNGGGIVSHGTTTETGQTASATPHIFKGYGQTQNIVPTMTYWGGAPSGGCNGTNACANGGNSIYGGGGGGGARTNAAGSGGISSFGGNGGAGATSGTASNGSVPAGGGGAASSSGTGGNGANGMVRITEYF